MSIRPLWSLHESVASEAMWSVRCQRARSETKRFVPDSSDPMHVPGDAIKESLNGSTDKLVTGYSTPWEGRYDRHSFGQLRCIIYIIQSQLYTDTHLAVVVVECILKYI